MSAPTFEFVVEEAPEDYEPERRNPGRPRTPSPFDDVVKAKVGQGYQFINYTSAEMRDAAVKELQKACTFHNLGLDKYDNEEQSRIEWRAREKQRRAPRGSKKAAALEAQPEDNGDSDE